MRLSSSLMISLVGFVYFSLIILISRSTMVSSFKLMLPYESLASRQLLFLRLCGTILPNLATLLCALLQTLKACSYRTFVLSSGNLPFLCVFSLCRYRCMMVSQQGMKCNLGQMALRCFPWHSEHSITSNQSGTFFMRSRMVQQNSQSISVRRRISMNLLQGRKKKMQYCSERSSCGMRLRRMKSRLSRRGLSVYLRLMASMMKSLGRKVDFRQAKPIWPAFRMIRLQSSSTCCMTSSGWLTLISMPSAKLQRVLLTKALKKSILSKIFLLDSFRYCFFISPGRLAISSFSYQKLNFLCSSAFYSMQLLIFHEISQGRQFLSVSFLKILDLRLRSASWERMCWMRPPTQLMLQARAMQLKVSMKTRHSASSQLLATRSPNPTVSMMVLAQQQDHTYCSYQTRSSMPLAVIQLSPGFRKVMAVRKMAMTCAKEKLNSSILTRDQYCSLQKLLMKKTSSFQMRSRHWGMRKKISILRQTNMGESTKLPANSISVVQRSIASDPLAQNFHISRKERSFLPELYFTVVKLTNSSTRERRVQQIQKQLAVWLSRTSIYTSEMEERMAKPSTCRIQRTESRFSARVGSSKAWSLLRKPFWKDWLAWNSTGCENTLVRLTFRTKLFTMALILYFFMISRRTWLCSNSWILPYLLLRPTPAPTCTFARGLHYVYWVQRKRPRELRSLKRLSQRELSI